MRERERYEGQRKGEKEEREKESNRTEENAGRLAFWRGRFWEPERIVSRVASCVYIYIQRYFQPLSLSFPPFFLSRWYFACPFPQAAPRDYPVPFRTMLLICRPLFYNSFSHLAACRSFVYRRCERILAVSRDEETTFRESLDSLSSPSRFSLSFFSREESRQVPSRASREGSS